MLSFHFTYYITSLGYILTGNFLELIVITTLIIVHECGHYTTAKLLNFNVKKIIIYPFGGITKIEDLINKDINEELLIATSGIITEYLFYLLIVYLYFKGLIREKVLNTYTIYNNSIILFNLLPIHPLDG